MKNTPYEITKLANTIIEESFKPIVDMGYDLSKKIGVPGFEIAEEQVNKQIQLCCSKANMKIEELFEHSYNDILNKHDEKTVQSIYVAFNTRYAFGSKFKPWYAANIKENVGKVVNHTTGAIGEDKRIKQLEYSQTFKNIAKDLEEQYQTEFGNMFKTYDEAVNDLYTN